jgi:tetratricopeptide (TPR) repeat protein
VDALGALARAQLLATLARLGTRDEELETLFLEGKERAERSGDRGALAHLLASWSILCFSTTHAGRAALPDAERAVAEADATGNVPLRILARYSVAGACIVSEQSRTLAMTGEMLALMGDEPGTGSDLLGFPTEIIIPWMRGTALCFLGRLEEARTVIDRLHEAASARGDAFSLGLSNLSRLNLAIECGDAALGVAFGRESLVYAEQQAIPTATVMGAFRTSQAFLLSGDLPAALETVELAVATLEESNAVRQLEPMAFAMRGRVRAAMGDAEGAKRDLEEALRLSLLQQNWSSEIFTRIGIVEALLASGGDLPAEEIEAELERMGELGRSLESPLRIASALELRAELEHRRGDGAGRERNLREALSIYRDCAATGHAERVAVLLR